MITNDEIADLLKYYSRLMEVHGQDSFRAKSYSNASFQLEKNPVIVSTLPPDQIAAQKGIGKSIAEKVVDIINTGSFKQLNDLLAQTPTGILEMLDIKGIGPKKINTIWQEMGIESPGELLYACNENRLIHFKGFGEKSQQTIKEAIEFALGQQGKKLLSEALVIHAQVMNQIQTCLGHTATISTSGAIARGDDTVEILTYVTQGNINEIEKQLIDHGLDVTATKEIFPSLLIATQPLATQLYVCNASDFGSCMVYSSSLASFSNSIVSNNEWHNEETELSFFEKMAMSYVPPYLRTLDHFANLAKRNSLPITIEAQDIRGIIHSHSTYSDGTNTLEEMAIAAKASGFEYLVISDHSKSAFYANGLFPERIAEQHKEIDRLNEALHPFRIFKSIESDILNDGGLDYDVDVLASFDMVIASIHSNLKMQEDKAMERLMKAIENPFTTILGHPTGRLLLSRAAYPINHTKIIDACVANGVIIEINAHPRRLDLDWQWIPYAIEKGALLSIDPDAHWIEGFKDVKYGVLAARKGGLTADRNFSSFTLQQVEDYLAKKS